MMALFSVRRSYAWLAVVTGLAFVGCGDDPAGPSDSGSVTVRDFEFDPENIVVEPGASVTWTWNGVEDHDVTFDSPSITDSPLQSSGTFSTTMPTTPGTYTYHCTEHPLLMTGSVEVQ
jgi:plastocyanin